MVCGAGGFIGGYLVERLKQEGYWVRGVDMKENAFRKSIADEFVMGDLRDPKICEDIVKDVRFEELYQLAADMGGAGYIFTGSHDADIMYNSAVINLNLLSAASIFRIQKIFFPSSACIYPKHFQREPNIPGLIESCAYPADPDSEYGWEKLFSERLYLSYARNYNIKVRIARLHNIFGPFGDWNNGREKAPAAICRKVAEAHPNGEIEIWGDGDQIRSFLYIDECVEGIRRLMKADFDGPVNIGSDEGIRIADLAKMVMKIANKKLTIRYIKGPTGVRCRNSDNTLIHSKLGWKPIQPLKKGIRKTYQWIDEMVRENQ